MIVYFGYREYVYSVAVYKKISNEVGRIDNIRAMARKLSFLSTSLDIFGKRHYYIRILYVWSTKFRPGSTCAD